MSQPPTYQDEDGDWPADQDEPTPGSRFNPVGSARLSPLAVAAGNLVGMRIVRVSYLSEADAEAMGWARRPMVIELSSGGFIYASCDDEGNEGGSLFGGGGPLGDWVGASL